MMDKQTKEVFGAFIAAVGTVISAVGSTPSKFDDELIEALQLWGNLLQASGNALLADTIERLTLSKIGNEVQAIGNSTIITGIIIDFNEETKQRLDITGNWLQALGGAAGLVDGMEQGRSVKERLLVTGELLQVIGNSLQAISANNELQERGTKDDNKIIEAIGSWIQAVGSVLSFLAILKEGKK